MKESAVRETIVRLAQSLFQRGYTVGSSGNISARVEYRHANYGSFRYASQVAFPGILTGEQTPRSNTLRGGVSYKF